MRFIFPKTFGAARIVAALTHSIGLQNTWARHFSGLGENHNIVKGELLLGEVSVSAGGSGPGLSRKQQDGAPAGLGYTPATSLHLFISGQSKYNFNGDKLYAGGRKKTPWHSAGTDAGNTALVYNQEGINLPPTLLGNDRPAIYGLSINIHFRLPEP